MVFRFAYELIGPIVVLSVSVTFNYSIIKKCRMFESLSLFQKAIPLPEIEIIYYPHHPHPSSLIFEPSMIQA